MIVEPAPAKINLALHIRRRRPDGYHDLETLFAFARDGDLIRVAASDRDSFDVVGPFASALISSPARGGGRSGDQQLAGGKLQPRSRLAEQAGAKLVEGGQSRTPNLVERARDVFRATFPLPPVTIGLEKNLPVASGIGGGSADAAATLRACARLTGVDPHSPELVAIARTLGADVPACLLGRTAFGTGRGDDLEELPPLGDLPLLLVNPLVPLSTAAMFAAWDGVDRGPIARAGTALERARPAGNDFTAGAIGEASVVAEVLMQIARAPGCTFARLSGSGATCFGLFADEATRDEAAELARDHGWWAMATRVR